MPARSDGTFSTGGARRGVVRESLTRSTAPAWLAWTAGKWREAMAFPSLGKSAAGRAQRRRDRLEKSDGSGGSCQADVVERSAGDRSSAGSSGDAVAETTGGSEGGSGGGSGSAAEVIYRDALAEHHRRMAAVGVVGALVWFPLGSSWRTRYARVSGDPWAWAGLVLSLGSAVSLALRDAPTVKMAQSDVDKAAAALAEAHDAYIPKVGANAGVGRSAGVPLDVPVIFGIQGSSLLFNLAAYIYLRFIATNTNTRVT